MHERRFWPDPKQLLLLHICLQKDDALAVESWESWKKKVNLDDLDHASFRIMSLAYTRLVSLKIEDPDMGRIKGIYRYQWTKNKLAFRGKADLLHAFAGASIPTLLLKGSALCQTVYSEPTARPMHDLDLLVPVAKAAAVVKLLLERGWTAQHFAPETIIQYLHACSFLHPQYGELDLHWHVLRSHCNSERDQELWAASLDHNFEGAPTKILCPADQFLHACEHGLHHSPTSSLQWLVDACFILRHSKTPFDWNRLLDQAGKFELVLPVRRTLSYLRANFDETIPVEVMEALSQTPVRFRSRVEYFLAGRPANKQDDYVHRTGLLLCHYLRINQDRSLLAVIRGFPLYVSLVNHYDRGLDKALLDLGLTLLVRPKMKWTGLKLSLSQWFSGNLQPVEKSTAAFPKHEATGFYKAETILGQKFSWSEPEASLVLDVPFSDCKWIVEIPEFYRPSGFLKREPVFRINGQVIPPGQITRSRQQLTFRISKGMLRENVSQVFSWSLLPLYPGGKDSRILGLPLLRIWICPQKDVPALHDANELSSS